MGNHTIAERMFRFDALVMTYAPLRVACTADHDGWVWFTFDQPSTQFGSFAIPDVTAVGADLDRKLLISAMTSKHGRLQRKPQGRVRIRQV